MKVVVVATSERCPAHEALLSERIAHQLVLVSDDFDYARTLRRLWQEGEEFVSVEHDVVPWPGALAGLWGCPEPWCGYDHPIGHAGVGRGSLGCVRFSRDVIADNPGLGETWLGVPWNALDAAVFRSLVDATGERYWHRHWPPVAHIDALKRLDG